MNKEAEKLKELIESSQQILVTSHISPDPDAISSALLMGLCLKKNFPNKNVQITLEEKPLGMNFLKGYDSIDFGPLIGQLRNLKPELLILVDANNFDRISRNDGSSIRQFVKDNGIKTVIIDHHEPAGSDLADVYINQGSPAAAQDVYEVCFNILKLEKPENYAQITMLGLYTDTGGLAYVNKRHSQTFQLADELVSSGANIEEIINQTRQYSDLDMEVFAELARNVSHKGDFNFSFISDNFIDNWLKAGRNATQLHNGTEGFINGFIRNIGGRKWGFIVYRNTLQGDNVYSVSFRAEGDTKDVSKLAARLGGGGHKPAAGGKFKAGTVQEAVNKVISVIEVNANS